MRIRFSLSLSLSRVSFQYIRSHTYASTKWNYRVRAAWVCVVLSSRWIWSLLTHKTRHHERMKNTYKLTNWLLCFFENISFYFFFFFFLLNSWNVFSDGYLRHWTPGKVNFSCVVCRWRRPVQWKNKKNTNISVSDARPWLTAHTAHNSMVYDVRFLCVPWPLKAIVKMVARARDHRRVYVRCRIASGLIQSDKNCVYRRKIQHLRLISSSQR